MEFKLTIADPKTGKCMQKAVADQAAQSFVGLKIGDTVKGESIDAPGYKFTITGGSDFCGFPMRKGVQGARKRVLTEGGVGAKINRKGMRLRKTVCGEVINDKISQINLKITKAGAKPLGEAGDQTTEESDSSQKEAPKEEAPKEEAKEEAPKKEAKEAKEEKKE